MKSLKNIIFVLSVVLVIGCAKQSGVIVNPAEPTLGKEALTVEYAWMPDNMMQLSSAHRSGLYKKQVFYLQNHAEEIIIRFVGLDGIPVREIALPKGKGPGEVIYTVGLRFIDDKIYFMDTSLARISVFDINGRYIDDYPMSVDTGRIWKFDIINNMMYFNSFSKSKNICKYDFAEGKVLEQIGDDISIVPQNKDIFLGGCIESCVSQGRIYYGYESYPLRIEEYDTDLNLLRTITRKDNTRKPMEWTVTPQLTDRDGDVAVTSMKVDEKYLYVSNNGANYDNTGRGLEKVDASLSIFDRETGKYVKELYIEALRSKPQYVSIVGLDKKHIVMTSLSFGEVDVFEGLGLGSISENGALAFIIVENPMYKE